MSEQQVRLLLLDDNEKQRTELKEFIDRELGYQVDIASDRATAIQLAEEAAGAYDVALLDQVLAEGPAGIQVMQELKALDSELEAIILTAMGRKYRQEALQAGAFQYLEQPVNLVELTEVIRIAAQQVKLRKISRAILSERDRERVLEEIIDAATLLASASEASIVLLDPLAEKLEVCCQDQHEEPVWRKTLKEGSLSREIIKAGEMAWIGDAEEDERVDPDVVEAGIRSLRGLPIPGRVGNLGVLYVYSRTPGRFANWGTISVLQSLAGQAGLALSNLQAYGHMEALVYTSRGLTQAMKLKEQMQLVDEFMRKQLRAPIFYVGLYKKRRGVVEIPLVRNHGELISREDVALKDEQGKWSASGYVIESGQELYWQSQEDKAEVVDSLGIQTVSLGEPPEPETCFFVPLKIGAKTIGLISIQSTKRQAFSPELLEVFRALAGQLSTALENRRLLRREKAAARQQAALNRVVLEISGESDRETLLQKVIDQATSLLEAEGATMFLLNRAGTAFEQVAEAGDPLDFDGQVGIHEGLTRAVMETGLTQQSKDYWTSELGLDRLRKQKLTGVAVAPIRVEGRIEGTVVLHDTRPGKGFDQDLLERFADHASLALQKAGLLENLRGLQDLSTTITSKLELTEALNRTCQAAVELFQVDHSGLVLFDEDLAWGTVAGEYPPELGTLGARIVVKGVPAEERLVHQGEVLNYPNVEEAEAELGPALDGWQRLGLGSVLIVPIVYRERILGSLSLDTIGRRRDFSESDVEICGSLAAQVAVAIENARLFKEVQALFKETQAERQRLEGFFQVSNALVSSKDLDQVSQDIVELARLAADAQVVSLALIDRENQVRHLIVSGMEMPEDKSEIVRPNDGLSMAVMDSRDPRVIPGIGAFDGEVNPSLFWQGVAAALCLPVSLEGEPVGVMWFFYDRARAFTEPQIEAAQLYVNQAALAYDSAQRITELEHMRQAAEAMAGLAEVDAVLKQIARSACKVLGADSAAIWSYDDVRGKFVPEETRFAGIPAGAVMEFLKSEPKKGGVARTVMARGQLSMTDIENPEQSDFEPGPSTKGLLRSVGARSFQGIALEVGREKLGVLYVNYNQARSFGDKGKKTLKTFAHHAALALKKARLLDQVSSARDTAKLVAEMSVLGELAQTLDSIVEGTMEALACDAVTVYTYHSEQDWFAFPPAMAGVENWEKVLELGRVKERSIIDKILERDDIHLAEDAPSDSIMKGQFVKREGIRSSAGIPLRVGDEKVGVMFANYRTRHRFTEDELSNLELFSNQAAVAIQNAQLYQKSQRWAEVQGTLVEASKVITGSLDLQKVLDHVAEQAWRVCQGPGKKPALFSGVVLAESDRLTCTATYPPQRLDEFAAATGKLKFLPGEGQYTGILGRAAASEESQLVMDVREDPDYVEVDPGTRSELAIPLLLGDEVIGVLNLEHADLDAFDNNDVMALHSLAAQASLAIQHARLYRAGRQRVRVLEGLYEISQAIRSVEQMEGVYEEINENMARLMDAEKCAILLYDEELEALVCQVPAYGLTDDLARRYTIPVGTGHPAALWRERDTLIINDLQAYPLTIELGMDHLVVESGTRHTLLARLVVGNKATGIVQVSNKQDGTHFNDDDARLLFIFAAQAAAVIENARLYDDLRRTKGLIGGRTALAWMGMTSSAWRHTIDKHALTIKEQAELLRRDWERMSSQYRAPKVGKRIQRIGSLATRILEKPITPPLSSEEGIEAVSVNALVGERAKQSLQSDRNKNIQLKLDLQLPESETIYLSPAWLRRAIDILSDNAVDAVRHSSVREITIGTRAVGTGVEISVTDTGSGIPGEIRSKIGREPIEKPDDAKGMGMGLLIAHTIVQTYEGVIDVAHTGPDGTTMLIWLPSSGEKT